MTGGFSGIIAHGGRPTYKSISSSETVEFKRYNSWNVEAIVQVGFNYESEKYEAAKVFEPYFIFSGFEAVDLK